MDWIKSTQISEWAKKPEAKSTLPLVLSRLIRATAPIDSFVEFPTGADTYLGGWDGVVKCNKATAFVPEGLSCWELGTEEGSKRKADHDYDKRTANPGDCVPAECTLVFVSSRRWTQKNKWVAAKRAENIWKDVVVYDATNLEQWFRDVPAVAWWFAVLSGNMPGDGILCGEQSWKEYAESPKYTLATQVLTGSRLKEADALRTFLKDSPTSITVKARSREEALAFVLAAGTERDEQTKQGFLSKCLIIDNPQSFREVSNNRFGLILIAKFEDTQPIHAAVSMGHHVVLPIGADDSRYTGRVVSLHQLGRELEGALIASGVAPEEARKYMIESGRDLTILKRQMNFSVEKIKWAAADFAPLLLPALFLGRWDEEKKGDVALLEGLAGESYISYIEKLNRWRSDPHPLVYQIGRSWRLTSPLDAWTLLAGHITATDLSRFETAALSVLGQVKPRFGLPSDLRFMAAVYGKDSIYSTWARVGVTQSLILFALFGNSLRLPVGDSQHWVDGIVSRVLQSDNPDVWRSLNDVMPLVAEAAPRSFLTSIFTALMQKPATIMGMFEEELSMVFPHSSHTGLLWALEGLAWIPEYLEKATAILVKLAMADPGGRLANRPINSLRAIFLPWRPMTWAGLEERFGVLKGVVERHADWSWSLLTLLLPNNHQHVGENHETRWRSFGVESRKRAATVTDVLSSYTRLIDLALPVTGLDEGRLQVLLDASTSGWIQPNDRQRIIDHVASVAGDVRQENYAILNWVRNLLRHHRSYPGQSWALPEPELVRCERLLPLFEPKDAIETCKQLFEVSHPIFPEMAELDNRDWQAEEDFLREKRIVAIKAVYLEHGLSRILELSTVLVEKGIFGGVLSYCIEKREEQLEIIRQCGLNAAEHIDVGAAFTWENANRLGIGWVMESYAVLVSMEVPPIDRARFLTWMPLSTEVFQFVESLEAEIVAEYWQRNRPWIRDLADPEKAIAIERLLAADRSVQALELINYYPTVFTTELIIRTIGASFQDNFNRRPAAYYVENLFRELYRRKDFDRAEMAKLEWNCLPLISVMDRPRYSQVLQGEMAAQPEFFVNVLAFLYKEEGDETPAAPLEPNEQKAISANLAWHLLHDWRRIPGTTDAGTIDAVRLDAWVVEARQLANDKRRLQMADNHIGRVLAHFPDANSFTIPPDFICGIIERVNTVNIISGFRLEMANHHSFSSRGPFEGGKREWPSAIEGWLIRC